MSREHYPALPWQITLDRESGQSVNRLNEVHDVLSRSEDSYMRYAAAWALLYASQSDQPSADETLDRAKKELDNIAKSKVHNIYGWANGDLPLKAKLCNILAEHIRSPDRVLYHEERVTTFESLEPVLALAVDRTEARNSAAQGFLSEAVIAALSWRPYPRFLSVLNTVPSGPTKDGRTLNLTRYGTDLYTYHPTLPSTRKGRVNLQIKTTLKSSDFARYGQEAIIVIGLDEVVYPADGEPMTGREASLWLAKTLLKDMRNEPLELHEDEALMYTMGSVYDRVVNLAEEKVERYRQHRRSKKRKRELELSAL